MSPFAEIQLVAALLAAACALPGVFLLLRGMSMMADAISHAVLLGIVLAFLAVGRVDSPWLVIAAAGSGVLTVALVELLQQTRLLKADAAVGLVFPFLFSLAVVLIARHARGVHLDVDAVLLGELAFAPLDRLRVGGADWGPRGAWIGGAALLANLAFIVVLFKELKLATFDPALAETLGFRPGRLHYALMTVVAVTAVAAFDAVGSILVVAFMIVPPAAAALLCRRLAWMLAVAVGLGAAGALLGHPLARAVNTNIGGAIAVVQGGLFAVAWLCAPERGLLARARRTARQRVEFRERLLLVHLRHHAARGEAEQENLVATLHAHLHWPREVTARALRRAVDGGRVAVIDARAELTDEGRATADRALLGGG